MTAPLELIRANGGAISVARLHAAGATVADLRASVRDGRIVRVRPGWVALPDAPFEVIGAVRVGGALTGNSVAKLHGLWLLDDERLHVRVPPTASRLRSPHDRSVPLDARGHGVCVHYRTVAGKDERGARPARDGLVTAVAEMFQCAGAVPAMIALESALNRGAVQMQAIEQLRAALPAWVGRCLDDVSCDSDSGLETIARMLMRRLRVGVRAQVAIADVRRVDLLVGDRLVLELDGRAFHSGDDFDRDRRQDLELALRGYLVVRVSYRMVVEDWDVTQRSLRELVGRGLHRFGRTGRLLQPFGCAERTTADTGCRR
jgi:very-short-patch-repair endonuclease